MSDSDDVLRRLKQGQQVAQEVKETIKQAREGEVPVEQVRKLESAVNELPEVQQARQQLERAGGTVRQVVDVAERVLGAAGPLEALSEVAQALAGRKPLDKVRFSFTSSADPGGSWRVVELHAREGLSELYSCTLDLANEHLGADVDGLLGSSAEVVISRESAARRLCGVIHRVEHTGTKAGHLLARVHIVPALWALSQRRDSYIFQEKTVKEILEDVLTEGLQPFERSFRLDLNREFLPREYCVQYRETDLEFLLRLMEEEGLFFYFDHSGEKEELVVAEENEQVPTCEAVNGGPITVRGPDGGTAEEESVRHFDFAQQLHTTSVVIRDFDWTQPALDLTKKALASDRQGRERELYEYPAPLLGPYDAGSKKYKHEQKQETLRRQALHSEGRRAHGVGYITGFCPGHMFELKEHAIPALDQWYLLTRVEHAGHAPEELTSDTHEHGREGRSTERYRNTFECLPLDVPFRPERRHPRARISGLQTATVVGPSGEEIFTDEHGRIKVQFHWDRAGQRDERSSCFLRVAQVWAGPGWGFVFLPRIGMEVLVDFLEGDPDRPIVVGCVYNGQNTPPYPLPEQKTRSSIRTASTPGGEGFNELRFEDAAGAEELFLHAQKDFNEVVLHNHSTQVKANQSNSVDGSQSETIGGNQSMTVHGKRTKTVDKDEEATVTGKRTEEVTGQEKLTLHGGRDTTVNTLEKLTVTGRRDETIGGNDDLTVEGDKTDHITGKYAMTGDQEVKLNQGDVSIVLNRGGAVIEGTGQKIQLHNTSGQITFDGGRVEVSAQSELKLVCGSSSITLASDGTITLSGSTEVKMSSGPSFVKATPSAVQSSAPAVSSSATGGNNEISGTLVKINS
ncbi:type VI secretion system Vgr family protein [Hyalangium sp.]|uniref:type VI secretion system Vgr family protein n=1 Tax=Hyalangium sp. TaxID=2028555 RepID=UPI002D3C3B8C|nr:type VI secretion system tip protein TssI/VgrG [Hyalangium sp.]HYH97236.1 type VI secretion system tip protein TssI/VgrG [Hyalangium sp.]